MADLYLIVNFFFVFASLIEFALVSYEPPVKTMAKSWLHSTREKLKTKAPAQNETKVQLSEKTANKSSNFPKLIPDLHKLQTSSERSEIMSQNDETAAVNGNDNKSAKIMGQVNGYLSSGLGVDHNLIKPHLKKESISSVERSPNKNENPLSLRQAMLRREKMFQHQDRQSNSDSHNEFSDNELVVSNKSATRLRKSSASKSRSEKISQSKDGMGLSLRPPKYESASSASPFLASAVSVEDRSPSLSNRIEGPLIYSGNMSDEFLEIKDCPGFPGLKRELYASAVKNRNISKVNNSSQQARLDPSPSLNMQRKPLETVIKMDQLPKQSITNQNSKVGKPKKR